MAKKSEVVARVVKAIEPRHPLPAAPVEGFTLLEQGLYAVLHRNLTAKQAEQTVLALRSGFADWNEMRVSQAQEIAPFIKTSSRKKGLELLNDRKETALLIKDYLQDVFQEVHGLELEPLLEDAAWAGQIIAEFKVLGLTGGAWLLYVGSNGQVPVHLPLLKILDKLGWIARTTSLAKGRDMIDAIVPKGMGREFTIAAHEILDRWNDETAPIFAEVEALREVPAAKKAHADWVQAVQRAEAQREREEEERRAAAAARRGARRAGGLGRIQKTSKSASSLGFGFLGSGFGVSPFSRPGLSFRSLLRALSAFERLLSEAFAL